MIITDEKITLTQPLLKIDHFRILLICSQQNYFRILCLICAISGECIMCNVYAGGDCSKILAIDIFNYSKVQNIISVNNNVNKSIY